MYDECIVVSSLSALYVSRGTFSGFQSPFLSHISFDIRKFVGFPISEVLVNNLHEIWVCYSLAWYLHNSAISLMDVLYDRCADVIVCYQIITNTRYIQVIHNFRLKRYGIN